MAKNQRNGNNFVLEKLQNHVLQKKKKKNLKDGVKSKCNTIGKNALMMGTDGGRFFPGKGFT